MADWRPLILPREHGIWGLLAGTALVGLPLGHDCSGVPLLVAAVAGVVLRQAAMGRTWRSFVVIGLAGVLAASMFWLTWVNAATNAWIAWCAVAVVCGVIGLGWSNRRSWGGSASAGVACGVLAGAVAMAGGAPLSWAVTASVALASHLVLTVPLVRAQTRGDPYWSRLAIRCHVIVVLAACVFWVAGQIPSGVPLLFGIGLARAVLLVDNRRPISGSPRHVGLRELAWMPVVAATIVLSLRVSAC